MKGKWVVLVTLGLALLGMVVYYFWQVKANTRVAVTDAELVGKTDNSLGLPAELAENFDPTKNEVRFRIERVEAGESKLLLRPIWPKRWVGQKTGEWSKIECAKRDIKLYQKPNMEKGKVVSLEKLFAVMGTTPLEKMILGGKCMARDCVKIITSCELFLYLD